MITVPEEIKERYHRDHCFKNIRIHFPNGERSDICNSLIVKDSVSFTESLCSQNTLKFGLCESPIFECEVVGVGNIKGATIEVSVEIEAPRTLEGVLWRSEIQKYVYPISYGTFIVKESKRQADMQHRKIVAYTTSADFALSDFELKNKWYYGTPIASYTPVQFLFALENTNAKGYDTNVFDVTELTPAEFELMGNRTGNIYRSSLSPYFLYTTLHMGCKLWKFDNSDFSISSLDNMFYVDAKRGTDIQNEIDKFHTYIFEQGGWQDDDVFDGLVGFNVFRSYGANSYMNVNLGRLDNGSFPQIFYPYFNGNAFYVLIPYKFIVRIYASAERTEGSLIRTYESEAFTTDMELKKMVLNDSYSFLMNYRLEFPVHSENRGVAGTYVYTDMKSDLEAAEYNNREVLNNNIELLGKFGYLSRDGIFKLLDIKRQFGLRPSQNIYPGSAVHPQGVTGGSIHPQDYQSCWYDDDFTLPYGAVYCKFKDTNNDEVLYTLYISGFDTDTDPDTYQVYDLSNNEIIKSNLWTENQIQILCGGVVDSIEGVRYMPVDFVGRGLPYVEAGDTFEILTRSNDSITTIVLNRTITGEQTLTDSYKSV